MSRTAAARPPQPRSQIESPPTEIALVVRRRDLRDDDAVHLVASGAVPGKYNAAGPASSGPSASASTNENEKCLKIQTRG